MKNKWLMLGLLVLVVIFVCSWITYLGLKSLFVFIAFISDASFDVQLGFLSFIIVSVFILSVVVLVILGILTVKNIEKIDEVVGKFFQDSADKLF